MRLLVYELMAKNDFFAAASTCLELLSEAKVKAQDCANLSFIMAKFLTGEERVTIAQKVLTFGFERRVALPFLLKN